MKKLFTVAVLAGAVAATAAMATGNPDPEREIRVDLDEVNKKIDARLHVLLSRQIARRH